MNFKVNKPLMGHDEDAPAYADDKLLIVCDGLGGGGQNAYIVDGEKRTSAYLGSRKISEACKTFILEHYDDFCSHMQDPAPLVARLKTYISQVLDQFVAEKGLRNIVKGKSMQMLPSTLAAIVYKHYDDHTDALVLSAGDSRAYMLTPEYGLQQISKDDVFEKVDAYEKTATMTNNIRQDGEYHINYGYFSLPSKCILFVCTDGCFDYIITPMDFEYRLGYAINKCGGVLEENSNNLGNYFGAMLESSGLKDDCTMAGTVLGFSSSEEIYSQFLVRTKNVGEKYRKPWAENDAQSEIRKKEIKPELAAFDKQIVDCKAEMEEKQKEKIIAAFQEDCSGVMTYEQGISHLKETMRSFEPYKRFVDELLFAENEMARKKEKLSHEYNEEKAHCRKTFKESEFHEFVKRIATLSNFGSYSPELKKSAEEYIRLKEETHKQQNEIPKLHKAFFSKCSELSRVEQTKLTTTQLLEANDMLNKLGRGIGCIEKARTDLSTVTETLKKYYMEDGFVEQNFQYAWQRGFHSIFPTPQQSFYRSCYEKCEQIKQDIDKCDISRDEKKTRFLAYLNGNLQAFLGLFKDDSELERVVCGSECIRYAELVEKRKMKFREANEFEEKKYELWLEYKPQYELFASCTLGGKV